MILNEASAVTDVPIKSMIFAIVEKPYPMRVKGFLFPLLSDSQPEK